MPGPSDLLTDVYVNNTDRNIIIFFIFFNFKFIKDYIRGVEYS